MFDTHAHVNFSAYKEDSDEVIRRAQAKGVDLILVGSQYSTSERAVQMSEKYDNVYAAIALHPIHLEEKEVFHEVDDQEKVEFVSRAEEFEYDKYLQLSKSSKKVVAIGETGLDYYHLHGEDKDEQITKQKQILVKHIELANELNLPMIIHCRDAYDDLIQVLKSNRIKNGGVIHCFIGSAEQSVELINLGFYLGFNGVITFNKADKYHEVIKQTSLEKIVTETDCPYLTPVPHRGKRNEPAFVEYVIDKIAKLKDLPVQQVEKQTDENAKKLFKIQ